MITKEQAIVLGEKGGRVHYSECSQVVGPRGGMKQSIVAWVANGRCKTWKRKPADFQLPIKYGLRAYSYLTHTNAHLFHLESECPLTKDAPKS